MWQAQVQGESLRHEAESQITYKGTARVRLDMLQSQQNLLEELDIKNAEQLKRCQLEVLYHIPAIVDQQRLNAAIQASGISAQQLLSDRPVKYPELVFPDGQQLECLVGQHRIHAGRELLSPRDSWWMVDLYIADANPVVETCLIEEYSNAETPSDGKLYRKIRQYHFQPNLGFERRWWARLKGSRTQNLKGLLRNHELTTAFDALLDIPGMWDGMMLTTLHKMMAMKCDEEILCYLNHIKQVWHGLLQGDLDSLRRVDQATVQALELSAPRASTRDARALHDQLRKGEIFGLFNNQERQRIWNKLRLVNGLVPSLFTFFKDIQYLQACVDCMKRLISKPCRQTVFKSMEQAFTGVNQKHGEVVVQVAESTFRSKTGSLKDQVNLGYRQLHACAMRSFLSVPKEPMMEGLLAKSAFKTDDTVLSRFASLANRLGFDSAEISALKHYPNTTASEGSEQSRPLLVIAGPGEGRKQRCGLPRKQAYEEDCKFLFVNHLHNEGDEQGESITSFFVLRSRYFAFFGRPMMTGTVAGIDNLNLPSRSAAQGFGVSVSTDLGSRSVDSFETRICKPILKGPLQYGRGSQLKAVLREKLRIMEAISNQERLRQERLVHEQLQQEQLQWEQLQ